jgi:hypothetical protein
MTTVLVWFLGASVLLEAAGLVALVLIAVRHVLWVKLTGIPWMLENGKKLDAIMAKLGVPQL